jgi:eukaryotic-like serine/threonine-protein kinase
MTEPLNPEVAILNGALELPVGQRGAYLDATCAGDGVLRQQVEALLKAHDQAGNFLDESPGAVDAHKREFMGGRPTESPGDRIGRYKLLQQIGEGGCGVVYLAEQEEPVRRRVALKIIKLGMDTKQVIARFEAERQALALMDHPGIAKVLDGGATETGRPYFVMELVRGIKITEFCDEHKVSTADRLALFIQVCQAIQHAHQKGIIHRDIKPSNILVTFNDGVPVPKVIDFGIAKATQGRLTDCTLFTPFEQFIGTPAYMSPEQTVMTSLDVDTRGDIYSLGVLLYELITGRTPFDQKQLLAAGLDEMRRTICDREPLKPSTCLRTLLAADLTATASCRQTVPPRLVHSVRGDLDWIVMKCLEKDRTRRYETANGLATDVGRHLRNEPVNARPVTGLYRIRKLIQRNKLVFAGIGVVSGALVIVAVGSTIAAWRVSSARRAEQRERHIAETANRDLRQTVDLLELERAEDFFSVHDSAAGVAHLAAMLRRDPTNRVAANRLISALTHRGWAVPSAPPMSHAARVSMASFSPNGRQVLTASWDNSARLWDAATGRLIATLAHPGRVTCAQYSPKGDRVITASEGGAARIWHANTGEPATQLWQQEGNVSWAEFSPDGRWLVTCSDRTARIWDAVSGRLKHELRKQRSVVVLARFSPDGERVVTAGSHASVRMWSVESGELLFQVEDRIRPLTALAFSPDGHRLVCACDDGIARIWKTDTGEPAGEPLVHSNQVWHAAFSPDSKLLLTTCEDGVARLWDTQAMRARAEMRHESGVICGEFSPDGKSLITGSSDNTARVWDAQSGLPLCQPLRHIERVLQVGFSSDGRRVVTGSYDGQAQIWDLHKQLNPAVEVRHQSNVTSVAFSPDNTALLTGSYDRTARLWNARTGVAIGRPILHSGPVQMAGFSPDGQRIVTASASRTNRIWDAGSHAAVAGPFYHDRGLWWAQFSSDGERVVTASEDGTARVWHARTARPITPPMVHRGPVVLARFSPDGRFVLTASEDHTARVWNAQTGHPITEPLLHLDHVKWADFSPDSQRVVTASTDNTACIWDVRMGRRVAPPLQHTRIVEKAAFSPDGLRIATISLDRTARIWDASTGEALTPSLQHNRPVSQLCFSFDGRRILTSSWNGSARLWDAVTGRPLTEWLNAGSSILSACFDAQGERIATGTRSGLAAMWDVPFAPTPVPDWFPRFAEAAAGIRLAPRGHLELVSRSEMESIVKKFAPKDSSNFYAQLARGFLEGP